MKVIWLLKGTLPPGKSIRLTVFWEAMLLAFPAGASSLDAQVTEGVAKFLKQLLGVM
jgi:hypothetical protein